MHATAGGKVLLAFAPPHRSKSANGRRTLAKITDATITSVSELEQQLAKIRELGYGKDVGEFRPGIVSLAVPLKVQGAVNAALSVSGVPGYSIGF